MRTYQCAVVVCVLSLVALRVFAAETPQAPASEVAFSIEAQPLKNALNAWASRTGYQILLPSDGGAVRLMAPKVAGSLSPEAALKQLLTQSGLTYEFVDARTVAIRVAAGSKTSSNSSILAPEASVRLAQAAGTRSDSTQLANADDANAQEPLHEVHVAIPEILVQGSRSLNMDIKRSRDDIQAYVVFDRDVIARSGARNIEEFFMNRLTSANSTGTSAQSDAGRNTSVIDLRGLGSAQTLILIDGHRIASQNLTGSAGQPDLNGIPLAAVERIEVLSTTASGIYGGGATGGVVNVVLRRDYTGLETKLTYDNSVNGGAAGRRIDMAGGVNLEDGRTNVLLTGSYSDTNALFVGDRDFLQRGRALILTNSPAMLLDPSGTPPLGSTTNIRSDEPFVGDVRPPLTLKAAFGGASLNSPFTFIPVGYAGPASDNGAALVANAGRYNLAPANTVQNDGGGRQGLLNDPRVASLALSVRREFMPWLQAFVDLSGAKNSSSFTSNRISSTFTLPATSASNPFNQAISVTTPALGTDESNSQGYSDRRAVGGVIFKLPKAWQAESDFTWSRTRYSTSTSGASLSAAADTAVNDGVSGGGSPFNIFRDTNAFPVDFSPYLAAPTITTPTSVTLKDIALRSSGPLGWSLPGGMSTLALLLEHRKEAFSDYQSVGPDFSSVAYGRSQSIDSIYLESHVPIVSAQNRIFGIYSLDIGLAARRDNYKITGASETSTTPPELPVRVNRNLSSTDPTVGFRYQPIADVTFRGSYSTGFLPPDMTQLVPGEIATLDFSFFGLTDPRRGNEPIGVFTLATGGNPNLRPEESESRSAGVILTPRFVPGLRASVDWTKIEKHDNVSIVDLDQDSINNELLVPGLIVRGAPSGGFSVGPITTINNTWINVAHQTVEAYDLAADYRVETSTWGTFNLSTAATRNVHNTQQVLITLPSIESIGWGTPKWRVNGAFTWTYQAWTLGWVTRWYGSYCLRTACASDDTTVAQGSTTIPSQTYHDLSVSYRSGASFASSLLANMEIQLGIRNVFNARPPITIATPYYSTLGDPRLASYWLSVGKSFGR